MNERPYTLALSVSELAQIKASLERTYLSRQAKERSAVEYGTEVDVRHHRAKKAQTADLLDRLDEATDEVEAPWLP